MFQVIGIEKIDFKTRDGDVIRGHRLHLAFEKKDIEGLAVENVFVKESISLDDIQVGDNVLLFYNKYGKVADVTKT